MNMIIEPIRKIISNKKIREHKKGCFKGLPVRPSKKNTRLFIDNEYFEKGYASLFPNSVSIVYCILAKYANYETQVCFPSIDIIMLESGIRRRNTVINGLKILEIYGIIHIIHSKGGSSNQYALLSSESWKDPNSINIDTVLKAKKILKTVSKSESKQYQKQLLNSITVDTGNHIIKLSNEIMYETKNSTNKETNTRTQLSKPAFSILRYHYEEKDILQAVSLLRDKDKEISFHAVKNLLKLWSKEGKIIPIREMEW